MTRKQLLKEVKDQLKIWASLSKDLKKSRKQDKRNGRSLWLIEDMIRGLRWDFRHNHIAYCELRGWSREQIECPRDNNKASEYYIDKLKERWAGKIDEDVRASSQGSN